ncbi:MAG TPA: hypothetical protein VK489_03710 [Ferruginibacter sp.]|nr:hypothetical protein [Ferruginibacter sp.]
MISIRATALPPVLLPLAKNFSAALKRPQSIKHNYYNTCCN